MPYRSFAPPRPASSARDGCWGGAFRRQVFWWKHCSIGGAEGDLAEAEAAIERLADAAIERSAAPADRGFAVRDIWLLRLRALLARAHGDAVSYGHFRDRYRDMASSLGFEGHIEWAEAMT
jgi:hypothetical protein